MHESLVQITSFAGAVEAEHAKMVLKDEGITASLDGVAAGTALSLFGTATGGIRLLVFESDAARAVEILEGIESEPEAPGEAWFCGACSAQVDPGFDDCWSCGEAREDVEQPFPQSDRLPVDATATPSSDDSGREDDNPYASPQADGAQPDKPTPKAVLNHQAELMVQRAWRGAIIGMFLIPLLLNIYSIYLLIRASKLSEEFSPQGTRRYYQAVVINILANAFWGFLLFG